MMEMGRYLEKAKLKHVNTFSDIKKLNFDKLTKDNCSLFALEKPVIKVFTEKIINFMNIYKEYKNKKIKDPDLLDKLEIAYKAFEIKANNNTYKDTMECALFHMYAAYLMDNIENPEVDINTETGENSKIPGRYESFESTF